MKKISETSDLINIMRLARDCALTICRENDLNEEVYMLDFNKTLTWKNDPFYLQFNYELEEFVDQDGHTYRFTYADIEDWKWLAIEV